MCVRSDIYLINTSIKSKTVKTEQPRSQKEVLPLSSEIAGIVDNFENALSYDISLFLNRKLDNRREISSFRKCPGPE